MLQKEEACMAPVRYRTADVDFYVRSCGTFRYFDNLALEDIARTDLHVIAPVLKLLPTRAARQLAAHSVPPGKTACRNSA